MLIIFIDEPVMTVGWLGEGWVVAEGQSVIFSGGQYCLCDSWQFTPGSVEDDEFTPGNVDMDQFTPGDVECVAFTPGNVEMDQFTPGSVEQFAGCC